MKILMPGFWMKTICGLLKKYLANITFITVLWEIAHQCPSFMPCCSVTQLVHLGWKPLIIITNNPCKAVSYPVNNLMISLSHSPNGNFLPKLKKSFFKQISSEKSTTVTLNPISNRGFSVLNAHVTIANLWRFWHQLRKWHWKCLK